MLEVKLEFGFRPEVFTVDVDVQLARKCLSRGTLLSLFISNTVSFGLGGAGVLPQPLAEPGAAGF